MLVIEEITQTEQLITTEERRNFLKLQLEERRRKLSEQAERLLEHYETKDCEREAWQGGDIAEF